MDFVTWAHRNGLHILGLCGKSLIGVIHICDDEGVEVANGEDGAIYFENTSQTLEYQ